MQEELTAFWTEHFDRPNPEKIICVGLNYLDHAAEGGQALPDEPLLFAKLSNSLRASGDEIVLPPESSHVDAEAELAILIGQRARRVAESDALEVIAGYTCANDVSARDLQHKDGQWLRAKSFDTFGPILTKLVPVSELGDARGLRVTQRLNGEALQDANTDDMIFGVRRLVAHISTIFTLEPGDLILTGTPSGVGYYRKPPIALKPGDRVEVEVEGIGVLSNPVVSESAA